MRTRHFIKIRNTNGDVVDIIDDFESLTYSHVVNDAGYIQLQTRGDHPLSTEIGTDYFVEVWRSILDEGIDWYMEAIYFGRTRVSQGFENGREIFTVYGPGLVDLLRRRCILYFTDTTFTDKDGVAETVMKEFVDENAGSGANDANRLIDGTTLGLTVEADGAAGPNWSGRRSYDNLLTVLQEMSLDTQIYFDVIWTGTATFEFRTYENLRGVDRRQYNIDRDTGLNSAGNAPVVFALGFGNMAEPVLSQNYDEQATVVVALGQGVETARSYAVSINATEMVESPWNQVEITRNAVSESTEEDLAHVANSVLVEKQAVTTFSFKILQTPSRLYGRDYTWGDFVTARYKNVDRHVYITKVTVSVNGQDQQKESLEFELGDIP